MESQVQTPFDTFPEQVRADVDGLIWLGFLEERFSHWGHDFVIRTLRGDEELQAALASKDYIETLGQVKAHVWATVGLALVSIDGEQDFCPPSSPNKADFARARFQWVSAKWYWPVGAAIYEKYTELLKRQQEALEALEDFCSGSPHMPLPLAGSWIDKGSSPPTEDIREYLDLEDSTPSGSDSSSS